MVALLQPETPAAQSALSTGRLATIDALRGMALVLMALDHSAGFLWWDVTAEHRLGMPTVLGSWPHWVTGLLTNVAAPAFWLLSGMSIALLATAHARHGKSAWATARFLWIRAGILLFLDLTVVGVAWGMATGQVGYDFEFSVLSSLAVGMILASLLQFLPDSAIITLMLVLLAGYQWLVNGVARLVTQPSDFWLALWLVASRQTTPPVEFPVLGWFGLMGLGFVLGRHLASPVLQRAHTWAAAGLGLLGAWLVIRLAGGYGNFVPYTPGDPWHYFLIMSKWPPSLDFFAFNLGLAALALAAFVGQPTLLMRPPLRWLVMYGRASLFFFVAHLVVYLLLGRMGRAWLTVLPGLARHYLIWGLGLAVLLPLCDRYRQLRQGHPDSVLRYL
jgi:uncharacterized membrane protein